jgi:hypothetical protein
MANYSYRIYTGASNTAPNFTTVNAAVADAIANDRTSSGVNGRIAASSTLYIAIDGFLSLADVTINGIDTTTNSGASIVVQPYSNAWNAAVGRIGYQTSFDGLDMGGAATAFFGTSAGRQANLYVRDLVIRTASAANPIAALYGPTTGAISNYLERCFCVHEGSGGNTKGVALDAGGMIQCVVFSPGNGINLIENIGRSTANPVDQCTMIGLGTLSQLCSNLNDPLPLIRNSYIGASFTNFTNSGTWSSSCVGNATDRSSWTGPTGTLTSVALSTTNFENVTSGTEDFRAKAASTLATTGATRLSGVTTDIFGASRQTPTTIGAFEALGSGSSIAAISNYHRMMRRA